MMPKGKTFIIVGGALLLGALYFYFGYLYRDSRNIHEENPVYTISSKALAGEYSQNAVAANSKYLNKTILVNGIVTHAADSVITLDSVIFCSFNRLSDKNLVSKAIKIKGRCIGYDELFNEVKFDQCSIKE